MQPAESSARPTPGRHPDAPTGSTSVGRQVAILHRFWQVYVDRALAPLGIGSGQVPILMFLLREDGVTQACIGQHLRVDKGTMARNIRRLVDEGYVERRPDPVDGRAYDIRVTPKARQVEGRLRSILGRWTEEVTQDFSPEERAALLGTLDRLAIRAEAMIRPEGAAEVQEVSQ